MEKLKNDEKKKDKPEFLVKKSDFINWVDYGFVFFSAAGIALITEIVIYLGAAICEVFHWIWLLVSCNLEGGSAFGNFWNKSVFYGMTTTIWAIALIISVIVVIGRYRADRKRMMRANEAELLKRTLEENRKKSKEIEQHNRKNAEKFKEDIEELKTVTDQGAELIGKYQKEYSALDSAYIRELTHLLYSWENTLAEANAFFDSENKNGGV